MEFFTHDGFANATSIGAGRAPGGLVEHHLSGTDLFCVAAVWIACLGTLHFASNRTVGRLAAKLGIKFSNSQLRGIESRVVCGVHCAISAGGAALLLKGRFVGGVNVFNLHPGVFSRAEAAFVAMEVGELVYMTLYDLWCEPGALELLHHVLGIVAETSCLLTSSGVSYMLWVHLAQATQPFLYFSWILYQANMSSSVTCVASTLTCIVLWFALRVVSVLLLVRSLWASGIEKGEFASQLHFNVAFAITLAFAALNIVWFKKMLAKVLKVVIAAKSEPSSAAACSAVKCKAVAHIGAEQKIE
ncbi:hypothetical protein KFE25_006998 [Diacronema lutheri]|uniref:TLC domain-containing protein n=1 Tax=Diacronema lutheri TaxID=2081491 RepID=A0A8J6CEA7_DIALT|nr:hypothetical protein KFE25_006998 [Diacronema lutheri]